MPLSDANITGLYLFAGAFVTAIAPVLILLINNRSARLAAVAARQEAADIAKAVADAATARDVEAARSRSEMTAHIATVSDNVALVKVSADRAAVQTDGIIEKVAALAEATGHAKGELSGQKTGEETGKQREQELQATVAEAVDTAGKDNKT